MTRPYTDQYPEYLKQQMTLGRFDCDICKDWDICRTTFYVWLKEHPELKEAYDKGLAACESTWLQKGLTWLEQDNSQAFRYWSKIMNIKFPGWNDKLHPQGQAANQINIGSVNILNQRDRQQNLEFIADKLKELDYTDEVIDVIPESRFKNG